MNRKIAAIVAVVLLLLIGSAIPPSPSAASDITIVGVVNDSSQIVADEMIFEVDDTREGNKLVTDYIGQTVKVTGKLNIEGDMRIISVQKFEVLDD
jgi:hypothetical protein